MDSFDLKKFLDIAVKRRWWIIIPFLLICLGGLSYSLSTPKIYEAQTLILVQQQKVPEEYVRSIITSGVEDRLRTITQQVTSRTNLEKIIQEFGLYTHLRNSLIDDRVRIMRDAVKIDVAHSGRRGDETNAFSISFQNEDPQKAMLVTNALASNFISENLKIRESTAIGTSEFIADELKSVEAQLIEKEEELKRYRERYMGGLPEQLQTNLSILERLQSQLDRSNDNLRDAENRKITIQKEVAEPRIAATTITASPDALNSQTAELLSLKKDLATLLAKYTENHPDVIRLKETIARLEKEQAEATAIASPPQPTEERSESASVDQALKRQLIEIDLDIARLKSEIQETNSQIAGYQKKVEETPKREQELIGLNRDYQNLKELYDSLLNRKLEAEMAVSMERKQKGEQFKVIDPAKIPSRPIKPDMRKILLLTLVLGLGLGGGFAYMKEMMDTSYRTPEDVEEDLKVPVLISMPIRYTEMELKRMKRNNILAYFSVSIGFVFSACAIVLSVKGLDGTMNLIKNFVQ